MKPRFRYGEIVRVVRSGHYQQPDMPWIVGSKAVVFDYKPNEDGSDWGLLVYVAPPGGLGGKAWWSTHDPYWCDEDELEPTGFQVGEHGERVPADRTPPEERGDVIELVLFNSDSEADRPDLERRVLAALGTLVETANPPTVEFLEMGIGTTLPRPFDVVVEVEPSGSGLTAFDELLESARRLTGVYRIEDNGWECEFCWTHDETDPASVFLAPEIHFAAVTLTPWSSPQRRPSAERRRMPADQPDRPNAGGRTLNS